MRSINVYGLIQWECDITADNRAVDGSGKVCDRRMGEPGDELLDVTNPLGSAGRLARSRAIPERQVLNAMSCDLREKSIGHTKEYSKPFHSSSVNKPQNSEKPSATV